MQQFISLITLLLATTTTTSIKSMSSLSPPQYNLRQYQPRDLDGVKTLFRVNIEEEWGVRYHDGKYIDNARRYIDSVVSVSAPDSDLNNIDETYFQKGGFFWVLTCSSTGSRNSNTINADATREEEDDKKETTTEIIVGTCGLQRISSSVVELRRMCIAANHQSKGWGSKMIQKAIDRAKSNEMMDDDGSGLVEKIIVSTIEHSIDGISFYKKRHGFIDTIDVETGLPKKVKGVHGTPISEVFMEYNIIKENNITH
jgi:GNAT superfamily N-acetyltransferase